MKGWVVGAISVVVFGLGLLIGALYWGGEPAPASETSKEQAASETVYTCSMHPQIRAEEPGECPICGMELIEVSEATGTGAPSRGVVLSESARARARIRTVPVVRQGSSQSSVRLLGKIEANEAKRRAVTTWISGRIDRLWVNTTGERVRKGQVVATLYSPEVYSAHRDLLVAKRQSEAGVGEATLEATRARLTLLGVPAAEIARMERRDEPVRAVPIRSPYAGTVLERLATEGAYVDAGAPLYRIADLSSVWLQLDVYEDDLGQVRVGADVSVSVESLPGLALSGTVEFIEPEVDEETRTARARVVLENDQGRLRPGMFAQASVQSEALAEQAAPLVIPETAPLFTGRRALVYVEHEHANGIHYLPRTVRLGPRMGDVYPVVAGLSQGERIVMRGAFAIDADLQIRGGDSMMSQMTSDAAERAVPEPSPESEKMREQLGPPLEAYIAVQEALAEDDLPSAASAAERLAESVADMDQELGLAQPSGAIASAESIEQARAAFEPLSAAIADLLRRFGNPLSSPLRLAFCPMAFGDEGAAWVQQKEKIDNAYFGATMRRCGSVLEEVSPGAHLQAARNKPSGPVSHEGHVH